MSTKIKKWWDKFLVTLGYIFIGVLSVVAGIFVWKFKKKKVNYENLKPGDIINSLPNADAVRERIRDFGTSRRDNGERNSGDVSPDGDVDDRDTGGGCDSDITRWLESTKQMGVGGTRPVLRVSGSGSDTGTDEGNRKTEKAT